mmetsp:Transcript_138958/g.241627  ORF Transcript_138958/g.241627 Transcript_138958/m.241627 type:complete len:306 (+) Transcript_138958:1432-2349(+)
MVSNQGLGLAITDRGALHSSNDTVDSIIHLKAADGLLVAAPSQDGRLVHQVGKIRTRETRGTHGDGVNGDILVQRLVFGMDAQDGLPATNVRHVHRSLPVETTRTQERRIQDVRPVGGRKDNDTSVARETVHLGQDLVQRLLTLVVTLTNTGTTGSAHSINLIDEDQARSVLVGLLEQVPHSASTNTDEHLNEFGTRAAEERHTSLSGNSLGEKGLTGTRGANQQHPLGNLGTHGGVLLRSPQKLHDLNQILLGLFDTSNINELDSRVGLHLEFSLALAHVELVLARASNTTATAAQQEETSQEQ